MRTKRDIYLDILHIYRSEMVAAFPKSARRNFYGTSFLVQIKNVLFAFLKALRTSLLSLFGFQKTDLGFLYQKHWLYILGGNNYHSLKFIDQVDQQTVYVSPYKYQLPKEKVIKINLPLHLFYLISHLPTFVNLLIKEKEIRRCWDAAFKSMGLYESSIAFLKKHQPKCITFSNDHTMEPRAMILAAQALNIPTFYIQHACIRPDFPPLRFSHSFLEGQDSLDKYKNSGPIDGDVSLIGIPRMDQYILQKNERLEINHIGICSNLLDDIPAIESAILALSNAFPERLLTYRSHPSDTRTIQLSPNINISNSKEVNAFEFLRQQDLIIAGNTSIHYEAAMLQVHAIYHKFGDTGGTEDMYRFVANGLVEEAIDTQQLISLIKQKPALKEDLKSKAQYYNALLRTADEGKSQSKVIEIMTGLLKQERRPVEGRLT